MQQWIGKLVVQSQAQSPVQIGIYASYCFRQLFFDRGKISSVLIICF